MVFFSISLVMFDSVKYKILNIYNKNRYHHLNLCYRIYGNSTYSYPSSEGVNGVVKLEAMVVVTIVVIFNLHPSVVSGEGGVTTTLFTKAPNPIHRFIVNEMSNPNRPPCKLEKIPGKYSNVD